jgi:hypothetical protein
MFSALFTNMILAGVVIGFGVGLLNRIGIIPVVRFKSIFKALIVLTVVITIIQAIA